MPQSILYYPTININDGAWLRSALLYWDGISSIVPYENYAHLSPELLFLENQGIYRPVYPQDLFFSEYASDFIDEFIRRLSRTHYSMVKNRADREKLDRKRVYVHRNKIHAPALHELIHYRKIPNELIELLEDSGFARDYNNDGWMEIDARVAQIYMRTFAEFAVKCYDENIVIGTDRKSYQNQLYCNTAKRRNNSCINISLERCLPQPRMDASFEDILYFKNEHRDELLQFMSMLRSYERQLAQAKSVEEIGFYTEQFKEAWQSAIKQTQRLFAQARSAFVWGTAQTLLAVPGLVQSGGALIEGIPTDRGKAIVTASMFGGTAFVGVKNCYIAYKDKVSSTRDSEGFAYLLKAAQSDLISIV